MAVVVMWRIPSANSYAEIESKRFLCSAWWLYNSSEQMQLLWENLINHPCKQAGLCNDTTTVTVFFNTIILFERNILLLKTVNG